MKLLFSMKIKDGMIEAILSEMIFEIILNLKLAKAMGLNFFMLSASLNLASKMIVSYLYLGRI